jgi:hypothetical protein
MLIAQAPTNQNAERPGGAAEAPLIQGQCVRTVKTAQRPVELELPPPAVLPLVEPSFGVCVVELSLGLEAVPDAPPTSVTAVTESGLMTIITGFPSLSFARTRKELGIIWMSVKPAC